ncbi:type IV secretory pathway TrbL component [Xanthobacter flavus]|uniref:Type IV secretory pathway TrbL component n=1 Tax=Xanthobacter flavus TaxID=281 RepID=A0ABU1KBS4_XANFL|nr:hypothetical protein [Xanthobacter flavus]MDR6331919.1 type IV secretory pathway TrbL component [Xanthobacter flavus]
MELLLTAAASLTTAATGAGAAAAAAAPVAVLGAAGPLAVPTFMGTAGATAAAGGGLLGALTGGSALSSVLSGGVTVLSALRGLDAAKEKSFEADMKAADTRQQITDEREAAARRRINLKDEMYDVLGKNDVATAAAGIDLSYGFGQQQRETVLAKGAQEVSIDSATEARRLRELKMREENYKRISRGARNSGTLSAALAVGEGATKLAGRYG